MALGKNKGFVPPASPSFAIRKLKRGADGTIYVVFVDPKTGREIENVDNYRIITAGNKTLPSMNESSREDPAPITKALVNPSDTTNATDSNMSRSVASSVSREMANDFGYVNKPGWMGFAGFMPGPFGMLGKATNLGINANNMAAVDEARDMLGVENKGFLSTVGGLVSDQKGYIGDISYKNAQDEQNSVPVGFEAQDKVGRTTLTPNEARMRQQLNPDVQISTEELTKQSVESFKQENPQSQGLLGSIFSGAKSLFSSMFDSDLGTESGRQNEGSGYAYGGDTSAYPSAPELSAEQKSYNEQSGTDNQPSGSDASDWSGSGQVTGAIDRGDSGLW